jgi:hypothetical protein
VKVPNRLTKFSTWTAGSIMAQEIISQSGQKTDNRGPRIRTWQSYL